jgi:AraC-like DNA-binding protein
MTNNNNMSIEYREYLPPKYLKDMVQCYWTITGFIGENPEIHLPDGKCEMIFNMGAGYTRIDFIKNEQYDVNSSSSICGVNTHSISIIQKSDLNLFVVRFHTFGLYRLLKNTSMQELKHRNVALDNIINPAVAREITERIIEAKDTYERIRICNRFLIQHYRNQGNDIHLQNAIRCIFNKKGDIRISNDLAFQGISQRALEMKFRQKIGISAKSLARIVRLNHFISLATSHNAEDNLTYLALDCGFYDQAHFIHEFRQMVGETPSAYLNRENNLLSMTLQSFNGQGE